MANEQITFDKLPQAVGYLTEQMEQIRQMVAALQPQVSSDKRSIMGNADDKVDHDSLDLCLGDEILICTDGMYNDCPIDYLIESIRTNNLDIEKQNNSFMDNHSFIYILL